MKTLETLKFIGRIRSNKNRQRGFTLIELVIVLAILGVLAAIAVPQLTGLQTDARLNATATNIASEAGNQFAQDLSAGVTDGGTDSSGIDWEVGSDSDLCTDIEENTPSAEGFSVSDGSEGDQYSFTVPNYDGSTVESTICVLSE